MAATDGFSFYSMVKSEFIRTSLREKGYTPPLCPKTAASCVNSFCKSIKEKLSKQFTDLILNGTRFAISIDEYTSSRNRRFMNINLHIKEKFWNLCLQRIIGSMPAERVVDLVCQKLFEFGIDLNKHIVATVNDGASVMVKYGRLIEAEQQLCYAHGIHLAVCDFLYSKAPNCSEGMYFNEDDYLLMLKYKIMIL